MKQKQWNYPSYAVLKDSEGNIKLSVLTQFYQTGIYVAVYEHDRSIPNQLSFKPSQMKKFMKSFDKSNLTEECKDWAVEFGADVIVTEEDGLYKRLN